MMFRLLPVLFACGAVLNPLAGQSDDASRPSSIHGRIEGDTYFSPTGVFKIKIPVLPDLGGETVDTPNVVTFFDRINLHVSVGAFSLTREQKWEFETRGAKDYLASFFGNFIMPDFKTRFPGSTVETATFLPKFQDGALQICALLPGGSSFATHIVLLGSREPAVAKRGFICFVKHGYFFIISTELTERVLERLTYKKTAEEEEVILRQRLEDLVSKITFIKPPESTP